MTLSELATEMRVTTQTVGNTFRAQGWAHAENGRWADCTIDQFRELYAQYKRACRENQRKAREKRVENNARKDRRATLSEAKKKAAATNRKRRLEKYDTGRFRERRDGEPVGEWVRYVFDNLAGGEIKKRELSVLSRARQLELIDSALVYVPRLYEYVDDEGETVLGVLQDDGGSWLGALFGVHRAGTGATRDAV